MEVAYIAGPYRGKCEHDVYKNIERASEVALKYWAQGYAVICPHKNTALFGGARGLPDSIWLEGDIEFLARSDLIVFMDGWNESRGAKREHEIALQLGKKIIYEEPHYIHQNV